LKIVPNVEKRRANKKRGKPHHAAIGNARIGGKVLVIIGVDGMTLHIRYE
jgi:hypothetical protein